MTQAERKKLLIDNWPTAPQKSKKEMIELLEKASKIGIFDYKENNNDQ